MKRFLGLGIFMIFSLFIITGCSVDKKDQNVPKLKIGVTSVPHGEILQNIKNIFDLDFDIINYVDYKMLNDDLVNKKIDANFFQTKEYMDNFNLTSNVKLVDMASVHIEPLVIYSSKYKSVDNIEDGDLVYIPNDFVNRNRSLKLLEDCGLIKLSQDFNTGGYIVLENPKNLVISEVLVNEIPNLYKDADLVVLNTNIALENNIYPEKDGIYYEKSFGDSEKYNVFVTRDDLKTSVELKQICNYLNSYETVKFINEKYNGFVKPVF